MSEHRPAEVFPPGVTLDEEIRYRGWTAEDFARISGLSLGRVLAVLGSEGRIGAATAEKLSRALGTSPDYWLNLDRYWRKWRT